MPQSLAMRCEDFGTRAVTIQIVTVLLQADRKTASFEVLGYTLDPIAGKLHCCIYTARPGESGIAYINTDSI